VIVRNIGAVSHSKIEYRRHGKVLLIKALRKIILVTQLQENLLLDNIGQWLCRTNEGGTAIGYRVYVFSNSPVPWLLRRDDSCGHVSNPEPGGEYP
jgi:hypothetical protein